MWRLQTIVIKQKKDTPLSFHALSLDFASWRSVLRQRNETWLCKEVIPKREQNVPFGSLKIGIKETEHLEGNAQLQSTELMWTTNLQLMFK